MSKEIYKAKEDETYQNPFIDVDEQREREHPNGSIIQYRYMHGGFQGTKVKFSFCFPAKEEFKGRFYQYLSPFPGPDEEMASLNKTGENDKISFFLTHGAYYVESNMGSDAMFGGKSDDTIVYKSSAAVAEYSRVKAMEIYACNRPYGYVYGGSGGGYKTMACIENTNAWDGAAPYVIGSPVSLPNTITMHAQGQRCLRNVFAKIVDAWDAGGSGDIYAGLNADEASMLKEITRMGFSPRIWYMEANGIIDDGSLPVLTPGVKMKDPTYFEDFWKVPGYMGADAKGSASRDRLQFSGVVKSVHLSTDDSLGENTDNEQTEDRNGVDTAWQKMLADGRDTWIELEDVPKGENLYLKGVNITFTSGNARGSQLLMDRIEGNGIVIGMCYGMENLSEVLSKVQPGDTLTLDNSDYIAIQSYYRHQVPADLDFHAWDQFRDANGKPTLPQREAVMGYGFTGTGTVQDGDIQGKVIVTQSLYDESTCPWCADWYRHKVIETRGNENHFRLYYMDRTMHGDEDAKSNNMVTNYLGTLMQVLLDLSAWVEQGTEPRATTNYEYRDGQIYVAQKAKDRHGMQPVVTLLANGEKCIHVKAGEKFTLTAEIEMPEEAGEVTGVSYGFEDLRGIREENAFPVSGTFERTVEGGIHGAKSSIVHSYEERGTHFVAVLVESNRFGDASDIFTQTRNLDRVRVVVE